MDGQIVLLERSVVGIKFIAEEKYQYGKYHGELDVLTGLYQNIRTEIGYKVKWHPVVGEKNTLQPDHDVKKILYEVKDETIYLIEINGVNIFATSD